MLKRLRMSKDVMMQSKSLKKLWSISKALENLLALEESCLRSALISDLNISQIRSPHGLFSYGKFILSYEIRISEFKLPIPDCPFGLIW